MVLSPRCRGFANVHATENVYFRLRPHPFTETDTDGYRQPTSSTETDRTKVTSPSLVMTHRGHTSITTAHGYIKDI